MPVVPKRVANMTYDEIYEYGRKGVADDVIFDLLELTTKQRDWLRQSDKWSKPYKKGLAQREIELAEIINSSTDTQILKERLKGTSIIQQKAIDDDVEFVIEAPDWVRKKLTRGRRGKRAEVSN